MEKILADKTLPRQRPATHEDSKIIERLVVSQSTNRISSADARAFFFLTPVTWIPISSVILSYFDKWPPHKPWLESLGSPEQLNGIAHYISVFPLFGIVAGLVWLAIHYYHIQRIIPENIPQEDSDWYESFWVVDEPEHGVLGCFQVQENTTPPEESTTSNTKSFSITCIGMLPDAQSFSGDFALIGRAIALCTKSASASAIMDKSAKEIRDSNNKTSSNLSITIRLYPTLDSNLVELCRKLGFVPVLQDNVQHDHAPVKPSNIPFLDNLWPVNLNSHIYRYSQEINVEATISDSAQA